MSLNNSSYILALCVLLMHPMFVYSQEKNEIIGRSYEYALFSIERSDSYPTIFAAIIESHDSLQIDTTSIDNCINGIYSNAYSAPVTPQECYKSFFEIWGENSLVQNECDLFFCDYQTLLEKNKKTKYYLLNSGETLKMEIAPFFGLLYRTMEDHSLSIGLDSKDYPIIRRRLIPIAILDSDLLGL